MAKVLEDNKIQLKDGTVISIDEIDNGYMRQADYTSKSQSLAEERKKLEGMDVNTLQSEASRAAQWDLWYETNKEAIDKASKTGDMKPDPNIGGDPEISKLVTEIQGLQTTIKNLETGGRKQLDTLSASNQKLERALKYTWDLDNLRDKHVKEHPDIPFDKKKLLDTAFAYGKPELTDADWDIIHNQTYHDEFLNLEVDKRTKEALNAAKEKEIAAKMSDAGHTTQVFKMPVASKDAANPTDIASGAVGILRSEAAKRGE